MSDMAGGLGSRLGRSAVAVECGGRCRDTNHSSDLLFENTDDQLCPLILVSHVPELLEIIHRASVGCLKRLSAKKQRLLETLFPARI